METVMAVVREATAAAVAVAELLPKRPRAIRAERPQTRQLLAVAAVTVAVADPALPLVTVELVRRQLLMRKEAMTAVLSM